MLSRIVASHHRVVRQSIILKPRRHSIATNNMAEKQKRQQPAWKVPAGDFRTGLKVNNSLTNSTTEFIPNEGKLVKWYICGPTVYDSSHLGHARNYITFDIIRRILEDYFGYNVFVCMNITDIDDKIILRARRNYLFEQYKAAHPVTTAEVLADVAEGWRFYIGGLQKKIAGYEEDLKTGNGDATTIRAELKLAIEKCQKAQQNADKCGSFPLDAPSQEMLEIAKDAIAELEDSKKGGTLDMDLIKKLTGDHSQRFEKEFMEDLRILNVRTPDALTRVSEYVPEIIEMTEKIMANGFAYESEGSVYFDTVSFDSAKDHFYAKLKPNNVGNLKLFAEGEGSLRSGGEKRSDNDFALWKKSKFGEPAWDSRWGKGRPGWHIECSAMAGKILGKTLDIHAGGEDLKFPHHDNELAQSEAYFSNDQWVNYFLHSGHLHIDGLKMSKSLKNFVTIRQALEGNKPRHLRMLFLLKPWDNVMNYQRADPMAEVRSKEKAFSEFFVKVDAALQEAKQGFKVEAWNDKDMKLSDDLLAKQKAVHEALKDNFNTALSMQLLVELVTSANIYLSNNTERKAYLLKKIGVFITRILRVFGVIEGEQEYGFGRESSDAGSKDEKDIVEPYVKAIVNYRTAVRKAAKEGATGELLKISDSVRDDVMPDLGVKINDDDGAFPYYFVDKSTLIQEREAKKAQENANRRKKLETELKNKKQAIEDAQKGQKTPQEFIKEKHFVDIASDKDTVPDTNSKGEPISKNLKKSIAKEFAAQKKANDKYLANLAQDAEFVAKLTADVARVQAAINDLPQ